MDKPYGLTVRAVIYDKDGRILLLKRSMKSRNYPGKWEFPGGKVDPGERFDDALLREVLEETGLRAEIKRFIGATEAKLPHVNAIQLVMEVEARGTPAISHEHEGLTWVVPGEIHTMEMVDWVVPFAKKYLLDVAASNMGQLKSPK
jgi:8-oxo-dGTP diphosphatase